MNRYLIVGGALFGALIVFLLGRRVDPIVAGLVCAGIGVLAVAAGVLLDRRR